MTVCYNAFVASQGAVKCINQSYIENEIFALPIMAIETKNFGLIAYRLIAHQRVGSIATFAIISYDKQL